MGRPRTFDKDEALDSAMDVFWRKGYEGASMVELTTAMGINSPSLYAAFGSKKGLFLAVLDHYDKDRAGFLSNVIDQPTAHDTAAAFLFGIADRATEPDAPPGCLLIQSGLTCGDDASDIPDELAKHRAVTELALRERFECAKTEGELPKTANPAALAQYLMTLSNGICIQASSGVKRKQLHQVVEMALATLPTADDMPAEKTVRKTTARRNRS